MTKMYSRSKSNQNYNSQIKIVITYVKNVRFGKFLPYIPYKVSVRKYR